MLALIGILYAAFTPLPFDPVLPEEKWGAGASSVLPAYSGLQREFPTLKGLRADRVEKHLNNLKVSVSIGMPKQKQKHGGYGSGFASSLRPNPRVTKMD